MVPLRTRFPFLTALSTTVDLAEVLHGALDTYYRWKEPRAKHQAVARCFQVCTAATAAGILALSLLVLTPSHVFVGWLACGLVGAQALRIAVNDELKQIEVFFGLHHRPLSSGCLGLRHLFFFSRPMWSCLLRLSSMRFPTC